jgi:SAM-dependent methyltransferase
LNLPDASVDVVFSYITLQHCNRDDALALTREAMRVVRPGGLVMLNYRTWIPLDALLFPAGAMVRALWRIPLLGPTLARRRWSTRLGWQANRLAPSVVLGHLRDHDDRLVDASLWFRTPRSSAAEPEVAVRSFHGIDPSHWWLIARRAD